MMLQFLTTDPVPDMKAAMERAAMGADYLDGRYGRRWRALIDVQKLDVSSPWCCVIGQLMRNGYLRLLLTDLPTAVACGFSCGLWDCLFFCQPPWVSRSFHRLTEAWKLVLTTNVTQPMPTAACSSGTPDEFDRYDSGRGNYNCVS